MALRVPYVVGNWKMNGTLPEARALVAAIAQGLPPGDNLDVGIAPPATLLMPMCKAVAGTRLRLGGQNVFCESSGAYTGEVSPPMLVEAGCRFVIIGHSERRQLFGETGDLLKRKIVAALAGGLEVIYCIGETLEQRDRGRTNPVLEQQLAEALDPGLDCSRVTIAYEPVWAIGTGRNATALQAQQAHEFIRGWINGRYGDASSSRMRIQYGGSVKAANAAELLAMPDVDGALVGGASLKAAEFLEIIRVAASV